MGESAIAGVTDAISAKAGAWKQAAGDAISDVSARTSQSLSSAGRAVDESLTRAKYRIQSATQNARYHVRRTTDEKPLQVIAGVAGAAFVAGVLLRVWRASKNA